MRNVARMVGALAALLAACADLSGPVEPSRWGGEGASLIVSESGAELEFDCAHARIPERLVLDHDARFRVAGTYVREHGGPVREGEPEDASAAVFSGAMDGGSMRLRVALLDADQVMGEFLLRRGVQGLLRKCL